MSAGGSRLPVRLACHPLPHIPASRAAPAVTQSPGLGRVRVGGTLAVKIASVLAAKGPMVSTIRADQTIQEAVGTLAARNIGALIVVDEVGRLAGIISERDIVRELARGGDVVGQR